MASGHDFISLNFDFSILHSAFCIHQTLCLRASEDIQIFSLANQSRFGADLLTFLISPLRFLPSIRLSFAAFEGFVFFLGLGLSAA